VSDFKITWIDHGREPKHPPDPAFPAGLDVDVSRDAAVTCKAILPYPARRCGYFAVLCNTCGTRVVASTAGRPDDPRSIRIACKQPESVQ